MSGGDYLSRHMPGESQRSTKKDPLADHITEDKDYTGCHPVIAEALRRGKNIECLLKEPLVEFPGSEDGYTAFVKDISDTRLLTFQNMKEVRKVIYIDVDGNEYTSAEPIKRGEG